MLQFPVPSDIRFTLHATRLANHRGISRQVIAYTLSHGQYTCEHGVDRFTLRRSDILFGDMADMHKSIGMVVIFNEDTHEVIAVYPDYDRPSMESDPFRRSRRRRETRFYNQSAKREEGREWSNA